MKVFQFAYGKAHWLTPYTTVDEANDAHFHNPDCVFVEASDEVREGWLYDAETGTFTESLPEPTPTPEPQGDFSTLAADVAEVKAAMSAFLEEAGIDE